MIMTNTDFIKKYGKNEFYDMCRYIYQDLTYAQMENKIGGFRIYNSKKKVKFMRKKKESVWLDYASIYSIGLNKIGEYIESR